MCCYRSYFLLTSVASIAYRCHLFERDSLVDADVFSMVHYGKGRYVDFEPFLMGRPLMLSFCTVGELRAGSIKGNWGPSRRAKQESCIPVVTNNLKDFGQIQAVESRLFLVHPDLP
jgi:hypothetical protein